ncbi:hypothetical protein ACFQHO_14780 [Actinomadura yumaensis]|uniref:DUF7134 domain-containing protein n=1 Tax=Actinomadura yumaensis TaxID=111807 RepID=UPI0036203484
MADFAVPAVLACAQLFGTWLLTSVASTPLGDRQWMGLTGCVIASCLALIWRRAAPGPVLAATVALSAVGLLIVQRTDTLAAGITDGVALYSLAVHRGGRTALAGASRRSASRSRPRCRWSRASATCWSTRPSTWCSTSRSPRSASSAASTPSAAAGSPSSSRGPSTSAGPRRAPSANGSPATCTTSLATI